MTTDQSALTTHRFVIIVAGGSGSRMKSELPKQFLLLNNKPILQHTIERFITFSPALRIILVLPARAMETWTRLCDRHNFYPALETVNGGGTRFQSVKNGLKRISAKEGLVAVHDGVRPFVTAAIIQQSFDTAARTGAAVTAVAVKDSVRIVQPDGSSQAVDRTQYQLVQTPQTFRLDLFRKAFDVEEQPFFTDCASVVEYAGFPVTLIEGSYQNVKITTPEDLAWGNSLDRVGGPA